jgi:fructokinase
MTAPSPDAPPPAPPPPPPPPVAVGLGEVLWDLLPPGKQLGGAPANFAHHAQQLGARSSVVSAVGRDELGDEVFARLRALGLDATHVAVDERHPTGTAGVWLDASGVPSDSIHEPVAWDFIPADPQVMAEAPRADVVCFGTLAQRSPVSRQTIRQFLAATSPRCLRLCDINLRQSYYDREVLAESFKLARVLKLNDQELPEVIRLLGLPAGEGQAIGALLANYALELIALTRGERGSSLYTLDQADHHAGYPADTVDTVGAGDAFTATLAIGLLHRQPLGRINDAANRIASSVCTQRGATPVLPPELVAGI